MTRFPVRGGERLHDVSFLAEGVGLIAVLALTFAAYWAGLDGPLVFDDAQSLADLNRWQAGKLGWQAVVFGNASGVTGRPVSMGTFVLNVALMGPETWNLKFVNVLLHLLNGALVFALFRVFLRSGAMVRDTPAFSRWLPLLGAGIWLLHPFLVSTVLYVVQRMAMLSALFTLLTMLAYLHGRVAVAKGCERRALVWLGALVPTFAVLATLSKENGVLALALCAVIEIFVFAPPQGRRRRWQSTAFITLALAVPASVAIVLTLASFDFVVGGYANRPFSLGDRLLTQPRVLWDYIGSLLLPYGPRFGLYHDDYVISRTLFNPISTVIAPVAWMTLVIVAWRWRSRVPGLGLGLGLFLVGHALESTVFPLLLYFEHRNYLPAVGAIWMFLSVACVPAQKLGRKMDRPAVIFAASAVAMLLTLALSTATRAGIWSSQDLLLQQGLRFHPDSRWLRNDLVAHAFNQRPQQLTVAREHADYLARSPDPSTRRLGALLRLLTDCSSGQAASSNALERVFGGNPDPVEADILASFEALTVGVLQSGCAGLPAGSMAVRLSDMLARSRLPDDDRSIWRLRLSAAKLYIADGKGDAALAQAQAALAGSSGDPAVAVLTAGLLLQRGDINGASATLALAERNAAKSDFEGRAVIEKYRAEIQNRRSSTIPQ